MSIPRMSPTERDRIGREAMVSVVELSVRWQLSDTDTAQMLGVPTSFYRRGRREEFARARFDVNLLERMSYLLNIDTMLRRLFVDDDNALRQWLNTARPEAQFSGNSPLQRLAGGLVVDLYEVWRWMEGQLEAQG